MTKTRSEALAWLSEVSALEARERLAQPYFAAAAVLSSFDPATIRPVDDVSGTSPEEALVGLVQVSHQIAEGPSGRLQLDEDVRRAALRRLGDRRAMRRARAANPGSPSDPLQVGLDFLIDSNGVAPLALDRLSLDELLGVERAAAWLSGILEGLPDRQSLLARIERERLLAPMRRLAGKEFVDREDPLRRLADYIGVLPPETFRQRLRRGYNYVAYLLEERPPLLIHGPGGVGKSTVLARFILDHADPKRSQPLPFVYLDFDRAVLDPRRPHTLMAEAVRQIEMEFPDVAAKIGNLSREAREQVTQTDAVEAAKSTHYERLEHLIDRFSCLLAAVAESNDQPVLLVLDTVEEAEYQGETALRVVWDLLRTLLKRVERLRVVAAGRSLAADLPKEPVELSGLDPKTAERFVLKLTAKADGGPLSVDDARAIVALVGTVPLNLALASRVVIDEGVGALRDVVGRQRLFARIDTERQQGMLYARILKHLHDKDPDLEKIASPGLIVRRITPEIIAQVLAEPCDLSVRDENHAAELFSKLSRETSLVDPYREPGALWHLTAIRRLMLPDFRKQLGPKAEAIHRAAVAYYSGLRDELVARAEEVYHRLCLGQIGPELDKLWEPRLDAYLRSAFEELKAEGKIWLADRLGVELDADLRAQADLATWERQAEQRTRTLMESGHIADALAALRERTKRTETSPLYSLEVDALQLLGRLNEARQIAEIGFARAERAGDQAAGLQLLIRLIAIEERSGRAAGAIAYSQRALATAHYLNDRLSELSAGLALLRLHRNATEPEKKLPAEISTRVEGYHHGLRTNLRTLLQDRGVRGRLRQRPALLREAAAEFGDDVPDLIADAVQLLGLSGDDLLSSMEDAKKSSSPLLAERATRMTEIIDGTRSPRGLEREVAGLAPFLRNVLQEYLRKSVELALHQTFSGEQEEKRDRPGKGVRMDERQRDNLERIIAELTRWSTPTRCHLPIILIRGLGLEVEDEKALAYQGFNVGSVYPQKRGENYIYEGMILRLLKHRRRYHDATNVVGYFASPIEYTQPIPPEFGDLDPGFFTGSKVVIDAGMALRLLKSEDDPFCTVWVFRYYDLNDRTFAIYGEALVRLIQFIQALLRIRQRVDPAQHDSPIKVNIVAHSMGGLIVREAIQRAYARLTGDADAADQAINKVVTLGTPHKGISFQLIQELHWLGIEAEKELEHFNPRRQAEPSNDAAWVNFHKHFPLERLLTVVGTNYRSYGVRASTWANRLFAVGGECGPNYNRSDGLVKQAYAQIDGAPRTFLHKCHGGFDSLITSREAYEIATRFFNGNVRARLRLIEGKIKRGFDWIGKSEFFFGVSIKPRRVDFELFHQSKEAENCYGPFHTDDLSDGDPAFAWADDRRLIWEGYLDVDFQKQRDLVLRADFYVGERDLFGIGFSDNVVFSKQYYVRAIFKDGLELFLYTGEEFAGEETDESVKPPLPYQEGGWRFEVRGTGFDGTLQIELDWVPEEGHPIALEPHQTAAAPSPA